METASKILKEIKLSEMQKKSIDNVSCKSCSNAVWQHTEKGIPDWLRATLDDLPTNMIALVASGG